jgi:hypothetical protein
LRTARRNDQLILVSSYFYPLFASDILMSDKHPAALAGGSLQGTTQTSGQVLMAQIQNTRKAMPILSVTRTAR